MKTNTSDIKVVNTGLMTVLLQRQNTVSMHTTSERMIFSVSREQLYAAMRYRAFPFYVAMRFSSTCPQYIVSKWLLLHLSLLITLFAILCVT